MVAIEVLSLVWLVVPFLNGRYLPLTLILLSYLLAFHSQRYYHVRDGKPLSSKALPPNFLVSVAGE